MYFLILELNSYEAGWRGIRLKIKNFSEVEFKSFCLVHFTVQMVLYHQTILRLDILETYLIHSALNCITKILLNYITKERKRNVNGDRCRFLILTNKTLMTGSH